jgi:hypothetical protein
MIIDLAGREWEIADGGEVFAQRFLFLKKFLTFILVSASVPLIYLTTSFLENTD